MNPRSPLLHSKKLLLLLLVALCCRSVVAAGFMLDTDPENGSLLSVVICPGQPNLDVFSNFEEASSHEHHAHHHESKQHEHSANGDATSTCALWTASSLVIHADEALKPVAVIHPALTQSQYQTSLFRSPFPRSGSAREPPFLS